MLLSDNIASSAPRKPPAAAIVRKGLKASGGQLSWVSQSVSVRPANTLRIQRSEDLCNTATAIVAHQIHLIDAQGIEKLLKHLRIGRYRYVLIRRDFGVAMGQQVHGYTAPDVGQILQLMTPQMPI